MVKPWSRCDSIPGYSGGYLRLRRATTYMNITRLCRSRCSPEVKLPDWLREVLPAARRQRASSATACALDLPHLQMVRRSSYIRSSGPNECSYRDMTQGMNPRNRLSSRGNSDWVKAANNTLCRVGGVRTICRLRSGINGAQFCKEKKGLGASLSG